MDIEGTIQNKKASYEGDGRESPHDNTGYPSIEVSEFDRFIYTLDNFVFHDLPLCNSPLTGTIAEIKGEEITFAGLR